MKPMLTRKDFAEFERDYNLFGRSYNGFAYWQSIRFDVCQWLFSPQPQDGGKSDGGRLRQRFKILGAAARNLVGTWRLKPCDVVCVINAPNSMRFFDGWSFSAGVKAQYFESCTDRVFGRANPGSNAVSLAASIKGRVAKQKRDPVEERFLSDLERSMQARFGGSVSSGVMARWIHRSREVHDRSAKYFRRLFEKSRCKAMVVVCYYQEPLYAAYEVAREAGVTVVELQHGVIFNHQEYWFEDQSGANNYTPDYFLSFGPAHTDGAKMLPSTKAVPVGYPFQERELAKFAGTAIPDDKVVVYPFPDERFDRVVAAFAEKAVAEGYGVTVKIHPLEASACRSLYPSLASVSGVEFSTDQSRGIYWWLSSAKHHVMASTTVGLEAVCLPDINIYVAEFVDHEQLKCLLEAGDAEGFNSAEELFGMVSEGRRPFRSGLRNRLWEPEATANMERFFAGLAERGWR